MRLHEETDCGSIVEVHKLCLTCGHTTAPSLINFPFFFLFLLLSCFARSCHTFVHSLGMDGLATLDRQCSAELQCALRPEALDLYCTHIQSKRNKNVLLLEVREMCKSMLSDWHQTAHTSTGSHMLQKRERDKWCLHVFEVPTLGTLTTEQCYLDSHSLISTTGLWWRKMLRGCISLRVFQHTAPKGFVFALEHATPNPPKKSPAVELSTGMVS